MKQLLLFTLSLFSLLSFSQIKGTVADKTGNPIPFANIYIKDTYLGTTTNEAGIYEMILKSNGTYTLLFQFLGYKTHKEIVNYDGTKKTINVVLEEEDFQLSEVVVAAKNNPADNIIKNANANRKTNSAKTARFTADFYSRGIFRVTNLPKSILGQKLDMFDEVIDSSRSGILYLSETVSKITFQKPDKMKEIIVASKVSGNDNGFSFNNAASANFDFYENTLEFDLDVISPIADGSFNYYKYKLESTFFDENNQLINKIKVTPSRNSEPTFTGYIYIVEDSWAIYAADLSISGLQLQNPGLNLLTLKQSFSYNGLNKTWNKNTQTLDIDAGIFGINIGGRFTYVYSNFEFLDTFAKKTFTNEVLRFEPNANKKEDTFWETIRPVPLTTEESTDYVKKEILQEKKKSKVYLDSIDKKRNKFKLGDILNGYTYSNSFNKQYFSYNGPLLNTSYNTVQGWNTAIGFSYTKRSPQEEERKYFKASTDIGYSFGESKFRANGSITTLADFKSRTYVSFSGGSDVRQFNASQPISKLENTISTLYFHNNFMKLYEKNYVAATLSTQIKNGVNFYAGIDYSERKPLFNTSYNYFIKSNDNFSSNNPLDLSNFAMAAIDKHNLVKANIGLNIRFAQKFITRPDGKFNIGENKFPTLFLGYEQGFAANDSKYNFGHAFTKVTYDLDLKNKGEMTIDTKAGTFINGNTISFVDYKHFNGNQTHVNFNSSTNFQYGLLPYYSQSTNDSYLEMHFNYADKGFIMNKIPLLNKLKTNLVAGFKNLAVADRKPYQEFSVGLKNLGFGKYHVLRIDYIRAYQNGFQGDGVLFGLSF